MKFSSKSFLYLLIILNSFLLFTLSVCNSCLLTNILCLKCLDNDDVIQILVLGITILGFFITIKTFSKSNQIKSTEFYLAFKDRFKTNESFNIIRANILELSEIKDEIDKENSLAKIEVLRNTIKSIDKIKRIDYAGFLEEIQVLISKKLVSKKDIYFSFGQYVLECNNSKEFWEDLDKEHALWANFKLLVKEIKRLEKKYEN